ncbi:hypothetical protein [Nannocystis sp.]|uniref:hypothetical protein n=1 Tax=Nannocystis sp. TaxID=1962667 RepID=UPI0025D2B66D|nr:hypothetical protein [Nannocystis sp.]
MPRNATIAGGEHGRMRNCAPLPLVLLLACVPFEPPGSEPTTSVAATESGSSAASGTTSWQLPARERDKTPSSTSTSTTTTTSGPPPATSDGGASSDTGTGPPLDLSALQIAELHPDPNGKDGGPDSPEFLEIAHVGELPIDLTGLEIDARAWPTLSADALGLAGQVLLPGERLLVLRFAAAADVPDPPVAAIDNGVRVAFASSEGLRNADGGVLLHVGDIMGDALIHGAAQPAPWDARGLWLGAPAAAPGPGESLCRGSAIDHDDASDWSACPPSPGTATELEAGTTGDDSGTTGEALPAEVAIVEVLSNPPGPGNLEKHAEFVEIENLGPGTVDLATWTIADDLSDAPTGADPLLFLAGDGGCQPSTCLAPGQRAIIVGNLYTGPTGDGLVLVTDDTTIANAGLAVHEPVALRDGSKLLRSTYRAWPDPLVAPDPAAQEEALVRSDPAAQDEPGTWSFAAPTPGQ